MNCSHCNKSFNTERGLKIHTSRMHKDQITQHSKDQVSNKIKPEPQE